MPSLFELIKQGKLEEAKQYIQHNLVTAKEVNQASDDGNFPLLMAINLGDNDLIKILLDHGANPDQSDKNGITSLRCALHNNNKEAVLLLVEKNSILFTRHPFTHIENYAIDKINAITLSIIKQDDNEFTKLITSKYYELSPETKNKIVNTVFYVFMNYKQSEVIPFILRLSTPIEKPVTNDQLKKFDLFPKKNDQYSEQAIEKALYNLYIPVESPMLCDAIKKLFRFTITPKQWIPMLENLEKLYKKKLHQQGLTQELENVKVEQYHIFGQRVVPHITNEHEENYNELVSISKQANRIMYDLLLSILQKHGLNLDSNKEKLFEKFNLEHAENYHPFLVLGNYAEPEHLVPLMRDFSLLIKEAKSGAGIVMHDSLIHMVQLALFCLAIDADLMMIDKSVTMPDVLTTLLMNNGELWDKLLDSYTPLRHAKDSQLSGMLAHPISKELNRGLAYDIYINHFYFFPYTTADYLRCHTEFHSLRELYLLNAIVPAIKISRRTNENASHQVKVDANHVLRIFAVSGQLINYATFLLKIETSKKLTATPWPGIFFKQKKLEKSEIREPKKDFKNQFEK